MGKGSDKKQSKKRQDTGEIDTGKAEPAFPTLPPGSESPGQSASITPEPVDDQNDGWQPDEPDGPSTSTDGGMASRQAHITPDPEDDQGDGCVSGPVTEPDKTKKLPRDQVKEEPSDTSKSS